MVRTRVFSLVAALVALGLGVAAVGQAIQARHVPDAVLSGEAVPVAALDLQQRLRLAINLPLRNQNELTQLLLQLYDPHSHNFRKYLTVEEFTERFGSTAGDYEAVVGWAQANGLTVLAKTPNRRLVAVEASVETLNRVFHFTMRSYQHPTEARLFYSPDREPTIVGLHVPLLQITGLNNYFLPRTNMHRALTSPVEHLGAGSGPGGEFLPSDMRAAYYGSGPLTGTGQSIGIFSFDGYLLSDVQLYYSTTGMSSSVPINNRLVTDFNGACTTVTSPTSSTCSDAEQVLDIVNAIGMAPGITQVLFYEGPPGDDPEILNLMAIDNIAKVLSSSWGWNPDATSDDPIFQEFAAQGQSYVSASGDCGAYGGGYCDKQQTIPSYDFPAVDPYITEVGGTDLTTNGPGGAWVSETGWSYSGGGYVSGTSIPDWQQLAGVINSSNLGSTAARNSPDVAAEANFDNVTVDNGSFLTGYGGTSFATPRWAGFLALVNQQSVARGKATVGFVNPMLYGIGTSTHYNYAFHDITSGSNPPEYGGGSGFNAVTGYDLVTGWGSPNGVGLINQLAGNDAALVPTIINYLLRGSSGT
jgi:subtilase family serine protease